MLYREFENTANLESAAVHYLAAAFEGGGDTPFGVVVTGGRTPLAVYRRLAVQRLSASAGLHVILSDERHVPAGDAAHNGSQLRGLLSALSLAPARFLAPDTALPLDEAARRLDEQLGAFLERGGKVTAGILGVGADGHIASLFSEADRVRATGRRALAVKRAEPPDRISLGLEVLRRIGSVVLLLAGAEKANLVQRLRTDPLSTVAGRVVEVLPKVELWYAPGV